MNEKPIERLNYYNGQRLEADDLKLEQEYHIRIRRWLNKSLYRPGIAVGLEVRDEEGQSVIVVGPGLALDIEGREVILLEEEWLPAIHKEAFLFIQYREYTLAETQESCEPQNGHSDKTHGRLAWGGPSRMRAKPILGWIDRIPHDSSGKIILARVTLSNDCQSIEKLDRNVRIYVRETQFTQSAYAIEGEKDIDAKNSKKIYFHIHGRRPNEVKLYLRAEYFSTLYYTEIGKHSHPLNIKLEDASLPDHVHSLELKTNLEADHTHRITAMTSPYAQNIAGDAFGALTTESRKLGNPDPTQRRLLTNPEPGSTEQSVCAMNVVGSGQHSHMVDEKETGSLKGQAPKINHNVTTIKTDEWGNGPSARQGSDPLGYVSKLQIWVDNQDRTNDICAYLGWNPNSLGDGTSTHPLVSNGTGPLPLGRFGDFEPGEHMIELKVISGGGRILYNLYVE